MMKKRNKSASARASFIKQEMNRLYQQNKDSWVDEIVKRSLA